MLGLNNIVDVQIQLEYFLRILLAGLIGAGVGYERRNRLKEAGVRTHMIVCIGSALMMIVSKYGFADILKGGGDYDASRIASQIVSGIGFLGAGMIFVKKQTVSGLTTAAGIWTVAGIGMAIGAGMYVLGVFSAIVIILAQITLRTHHSFFHIPASESIEIQVRNSPDVLENIHDLFKKHHIEIVSVKIEKLNEAVMLIDMLVKLPNNFRVDELLIMFSDLSYVISLEF
jgi:putative Mg2+ transporter-C (MgtC) family protein